MKKIKHFFGKFDKNILAILFVAFVIFSSYLFGGYFYGDDTFFHSAHLLAYMESFNFSDLFGGSILPDVAYDFGYGTRIFYPPLGYNVIIVIYSVIKHFGFSIFLAIKLGYFLSMILSGIFMYYFTKKVFNNKYVALLSAVLYMTMPYHILDIFFRDSLSEIFIFPFIPLVFLGLEYLFEDNYKKFYVCFITGYVFSMISHLVLSVYLTIFVVLYLILNYKKVLTKKRLIRLVISGFMILAFISPFLIPMIEHKFLGNYMVFYPEFMFTKESVSNATLTLGQMIHLPMSGERYFTLGYVAVIAFVTVFFCGYKYIENKKTYKNITILLFICFIMLTPLFPWKNLPSFLLNIQFPWRLELFFSFLIAVLASLVVFLVNKRNQKILVTVLSCVSVMFSIYLVNLHDYTFIDFDRVREHGIGEYLGMDYLPVNTYKHLDYYGSRTDNVIVKDGEAEISDVVNDTPYLEFYVKTNETTLELPRLYYLGYKITLDGKEVHYYENKNGFIEIKLTSSGKVRVEYEGTNGHKVGILLFILASGIGVVYAFLIIKNKRR